jgi:predicted DNA-binding helix-hairpin-helix protein
VKAPGRKRAPYNLPQWIYPSVRPDGKRQLLMKVLMSNACRHDCGYCANRCGGRGRPVSFTPDELVQTFLDFNRQGLAEGLFLSSAVESNNTMDRMLDAVELLRVRLGFRGYIHLKVLPGASFGHVARAVQLATRVSINLEATSPGHLSDLAPGKDFTEDLYTRMGWIKKCLDEQTRHLCRGQTTQFIVGATNETDHETVDRMAGLYQQMRLDRVYFSAFRPINNTPLSDRLPAPLMREHRLYQVDFLLRRYKWKHEDLIYQTDGNLSLEKDPKYLWAVHHPELFPVEINTADRHELLRVPGLGPISVRRILDARRHEKLDSVADLRALGASAKRAAPFILLNGRRGGEERGQQGLFR